MGIVIGSLATLRPLFGNLSSHFTNSFRSKGSSRHRNNESNRTWQSTPDLNHRLNGLQSKGSQIRTTVVDRNLPKSGKSSVRYERTTSQEELAPSRNIYKETTVERTVETFQLDGDVEESV